jgi:hypothetical protein
MKDDMQYSYRHSHSPGNRLKLCHLPPDLVVQHSVWHAFHVIDILLLFLDLVLDSNLCDLI